MENCLLWTDIDVCPALLRFASLARALQGFHVTVCIRPGSPP